VTFSRPTTFGVRTTARPLALARSPGARWSRYRLPAGAGQPTSGSAAPGGLPPVGRGMLPPRSRCVPPLPARLWRLSPRSSSRSPRLISASLHTTSAGHGPGLARRRRALDDRKESPHRIRVKRTKRAPNHVWLGQSNLAQMVRTVSSPSMPQSLARVQTMSSPWRRVGSLMAGAQRPPLSSTSIQA
jgi:hypothetical protein